MKPLHPRPTESLWASIRAGLFTAWTDPGIFRALSLALATAVLIAPFIGLIPIFAIRELNAGEGGVSLLVTSQGIGAVVSALLSSAYVGLYGYRRWLAGASLLLAPLAALYWLCPNLITAALTMLLMGAAYLAVVSGSSAVCISRAPGRMKGRIASIFTGVLDGSYAVGAAVMGKLGDGIGLRATGVAGCVLFVGVLYAFRRHRPPLLSELDMQPVELPAPVAAGIARELP